MKGSELIREKELKDGIYSGMLGDTNISPHDMVSLAELEFSPEEVAEMMAIDELRDPAPIDVSSVLTDEEIIELAEMGGVDVEAVKAEMEMGMAATVIHDEI